MGVARMGAVDDHPGIAGILEAAPVIDRVPPQTDDDLVQRRANAVARSADRALEVRLQILRSDLEAPFVIVGRDLKPIPTADGAAGGNRQHQFRTRQQRGLFLVEPGEGQHAPPLADHVAFTGGGPSDRDQVAKDVSSMIPRVG